MKNACCQAMHESARANKIWARQGDILGDPKTTKPNREICLFPHVIFQEHGVEDTHNPSTKVIIETNKRLKDVKRGASAKEVNDLAKP